MVYNTAGRKLATLQKYTSKMISLQFLSISILYPVDFDPNHTTCVFSQLPIGAYIKHLVNQQDGLFCLEGQKSETSLSAILSSSNLQCSIDPISVKVLAILLLVVTMYKYIISKCPKKANKRRKIWP